MKLTWLGHATWLLEMADHRVLLDPFLAENPAATESAESLGTIDHVLVSHGHSDHVADVKAVLDQTGAKLVTNFEIAQWFQKHHGVEDAIGMNIGGTVQLPFGAVTMVFAIHSSSLPDGSYGGTAAGFVVQSEEKRVYFACDTALFSDMEWVGERGIDVAVVPIGDLFTMGPADSIEAIQLINPRHVLPTHYNTWPPIEQDAEAWAQQVREMTKAEPHVLKVGESFEV